MPKLKLCLLVGSLFFNSISTAQSPEVTRLHIDLSKEKGDMDPIWAWFGYDEPNYTDLPETN